MSDNMVDANLRNEVFNKFKFSGTKKQLAHPPCVEGVVSHLPKVEGDLGSQKLNASVSPVKKGIVAECLEHQMKLETEDTKLDENIRKKVVETINFSRLGGAFKRKR